MEIMSSLRQTIIGSFLLVLMTGCFPFSTAQTIMFVGDMANIALLATDDQGRVELAGYSIGPVNSGKAVISKPSLPLIPGAPGLRETESGRGLP